MPDYAPWLRPADPNRSQSAGSEAGARLRSIREQAAASLRNYQVAMAGLAQRGAAQAAEAKMQDKAIASKDRAMAAEADLAGKKLWEDSRQADAMAQFNEKKLAAETGMARYVNTAGGLIKLNPDGTETLVEGTQKLLPSGKGGVAAFTEGAQPSPGATPPGSAPTTTGTPSFDPGTLSKSKKGGIGVQLGELVKFFTPDVIGGNTSASTLPGIPNASNAGRASVKPKSGKAWKWENGKLVEDK